MPYYEYECENCGPFLSNIRDSHRQCGFCGGRGKRVWRFRMASVVHEHFDHVTGRVISDRRQQEHALKEASEKATERTGIPHNYVAVDPTDVKALKVTDEGLDSTYNRRVRSGMPVEKDLWRRL